MFTRKRDPVILGLEGGKEGETLECSLTCELQVQLETMSEKKRQIEWLRKALHVHILLPYMHAHTNLQELCYLNEINIFPQNFWETTKPLVLI